MRKKYLFLLFIVASLFAYIELYKSSTIAKTAKSSKKLSIIEFERPKYNFNTITTPTLPKKEIPIVKQEPIFAEETTVAEASIIKTIEIEPKKIVEINEQIVENVKSQEIVSATVVDDIEGQFSEIKNIRQALLRSERTPLFLKESIMALESLRDDYGVDLGFAYRSVVQTDLVSKETGGGGYANIIARYKANANSTFAISISGAHKVGEHTSGSFANKIGSLYSTSPSYSDKDVQLSEFWYQLGLEEITFRIGVVDASSFIDNSFFMSSNNFFFNSAISSTPYAKVPNNGLGIGLKYVKDGLFVASQFSDANAQSGAAVSSAVNRMLENSLSLYSAVEFGGMHNESLYYLTLWHKEQEKNAKGIILSLNQSLDETHKIFLKMALSSEASAKEYISMGWGRNALLHKDDKLGAAYSAVKSEKTGDIQNNFEIFYRYDYLYGIQMSANVEFLNPIDSNEELAVLGGVRLRFVF